MINMNILNAVEASHHLIGVGSQKLTSTVHCQSLSTAYDIEDMKVTVNFAKQVQKHPTPILEADLKIAKQRVNGPYMHLQKLRRLCMGVERDPDSDVKITANIRAIS